MSLLAAWILFPLVLGAVALGAGLLVDRLAGGRLPGALLVPVGFATMLAVSRLAVSTELTSRLALPMLIALAVLGYALAFARLRGLRPDLLGVAAVLAAAAVYAAPVVLSAQPTFAGYTLLPDTSHQLTLTSFLPEHGTDWESLPASSYKLELQKYLSTAYPVAPQATLGILSPLGLLEVAWLYQPFLTFVVVSLAATLYALVAPWVRDLRARALVTFLAAQPALAVSFALQGSIKELTGCAMLVLVAALAARTVTERWPARAVLPIAIAAAAAAGALGPSSAPYLAAVIAVPAAVWLWRFARAPSRLELAYLAGALGLAVVLTLPVLTDVSTAYAVNTATLDNAQDLGNLPGPLHLGQVTGVWLNGDYRYEPATKQWLNWAAVAFALAAAVVGLIWAVRSRAVGVLLLAGAFGVTSAYLLTRGSPYADAKVMMVLSPAVLLLAAVSPLAFGGTLRRVPALVMAGTLTVLVLASNALAYHDVQLAPYDRYHEALELNERLAGKGPVLMTEYDEFGEYLMRDALPYVQPEWPHGYVGESPDRPGGGLFNIEHRPSIKTPLDIDDLQSDYVQSVRAILLRRSPTVSRPPVNFRRTYRGRWYEVWERRAPSLGRVLAHVPAGRTALEPAARPRCSDVRRLARRAETTGGRIVYGPRPPLAILEPLDAAPAGWYEYGAYPGAVVPTGPGTVNSTVRVTTSGRHAVWVEGSFGRGYDVTVDERRLGTVSYHLGNPGQYLEAGDLDLEPGRRRITLVRPGGDLRPGNGGADSSLRHVGPVVLSPVANERRELRSLPVSRAEELCRMRVDWVELVQPPGEGAS